MKIFFLNLLVSVLFFSCNTNRANKLEKSISINVMETFQNNEMFLLFNKADSLLVFELKLKDSNTKNSSNYIDTSLTLLEMMDKGQKKLSDSVLISYLISKDSIAKLSSVDRDTSLKLLDLLLLEKMQKEKLEEQSNTKCQVS